MLWDYFLRQVKGLFMTTDITLVITVGTLANYIDVMMIINAV